MRDSEVASVHSGWGVRGLWLLLGLALLSLGGCNSTGGGGSGGNLPPDAPRALVYGAVQSPIFEELKKTKVMVTYDGSQNVADYGLLILDADAHAPENLTDDPLLVEALKGQGWVLALDPSEAHKRDGLYAHLGFATDGGADAYLFRRGNTEAGYRKIYLIEMRPPGVKGKGQEVRVQGSSQADPVAFAAIILETIAGEGLSTQDAPKPNTPIPPALIHTQWVYSPHVSWTVGGQSGNLTTNLTFTLFLDNAGNPQGNWYYMLAQVDGESTPTTKPGHFASINSDGSYIIDEVGRAKLGFFQAYIGAEIRPSSAQATTWTWVSNAPATPDPETTYDSDAGFEVGFEDRGPVATFDWSTDTSYTVEDWGVRSLGSGSDVHWRWLSQHPAKYENSPESSFGTTSTNWWTFWLYPATVNELARTQMQFHGSAVWRSDHALDTSATFDLYADQLNVILRCQSTASICENHDPFWTFYFVDPKLSMDLGDVLPIPASIQYLANPVNAGEIALGAIVLEEPARMDTLVFVSSNSENAAPQQSNYIVPEGETTVTFCIETGPEGGGSDFSANVSAFYAQTYDSELVIKNIASPSPQECSFTNKWAGAYKVQTRMQGASNWNEYITLVIADDGQVSIPFTSEGTLIIKNPQLDNDSNTLSWSRADGNSQDVSFTFRSYDTNPAFWSDEGTVGMSFSGTLNEAAGKFDARGVQQ